MDRVLVVDDSVMLINYLEGYFKRFKDKFHLVTASDGLEAIDVLTNHPVSLLVTDLQMPNLDGLALLAYKNKIHPNIPCIVMSAHGTPKIKERLQPAILQFIEKPFTAQQLAQAIEAALNRGLPGGSLTGISIVSFLQLIEMERKTCLCEVHSHNTPNGMLYFKGGVLYDAAFGRLRGEEAAVKMIQIENATISFRKPPERKIPRAITTELTSLILQAVRLKDESGEEARQQEDR